MQKIAVNIKWYRFDGTLYVSNFPIEVMSTCVKIFTSPLKVNVHFIVIIQNDIKRFAFKNRPLLKIYGEIKQVGTLFCNSLSKRIF